MLEPWTNPIVGPFHQLRDLSDSVSVLRYTVGKRISPSPAYSFVAASAGLRPAQDTEMPGRGDGLMDARGHWESSRRNIGQFNAHPQTAPWAYEESPADVRLQ
jgi:hypothetical protein